MGLGYGLATDFQGTYLMESFRIKIWKGNFWRVLGSIPVYSYQETGYTFKRSFERRTKSKMQ
jgi:hypothetical protein